MDRVSTHILYLGGARPVTRKGNFSRFLELQEAAGEQREREAKRVAADLERKMDFVRRFRAKATKARQAASRQKTAKRLEKELEGLRPDAPARTLSFSWPPAERSDRVVLSAAGLGYVFPDGKEQFHDLDFNLYRGRKIALVGPNGCGKSTLLKTVTGALAPSAGRVSMGPLTRLGYFSQHQMDTLSAAGTVLGEIRRLSDPRLTEEELMGALGLFLLNEPFFDRPVSTLSGGEKSRLLLATLFLSRSNLLVLDEPTNHLDLESRETLTDALRDYGGSVLMVAHDRHLLAEVADEIWALSPAGLHVYEGGYAEYEAARAAGVTAEGALPGGAAGTAATIAPGAPAVAAPSLSREERKEQRRRLADARNDLSRRMRPHRERYAALEKELDGVMAALEEAARELADPQTYADGARFAALMKRHHELEAQSETLFAALEEAEKALAVFDEERRRLEGDEAAT